MTANVPRGRRLEPPSPTEELHILRRLALPPNFFAGCLTAAECAARLHAHLETARVGRVPVWRGRDETYAELATRWYGPAPISTDQPTPETVSP